MKHCHENNQCCNLSWKARDRAQSFVLTFTLQLNILTGTCLLVSCSNAFKIYCGLYTVKAKNATKNIYQRTLLVFITIFSY